MSQSGSEAPSCPLVRRLASWVACGFPAPYVKKLSYKVCRNITRKREKAFPRLSFARLYSSQISRLSNKCSDCFPCVARGCVITAARLLVLVNHMIYFVWISLSQHTVLLSFLIVFPSPDQNVQCNDDEKFPDQLLSLRYLQKNKNKKKNIFLLKFQDAFKFRTFTWPS